MKKYQYKNNVCSKVASSKKIYSILLAVFAVVSLMFIPSCAKGSDASIVGTWQYSLNEEYRDLVTEVIADPSVYADIFYVFNEDGTGSTYSSVEPTPVNFTYKYSNNTLTVSMNGTVFDIECTVRNNSMTITESGETVTFTRR